MKQFFGIVVRSLGMLIATGLAGALVVGAVA